MRKIVTIGETVLDIIFRDSNPVAAKAGGSMLNTSVSLGRIGLPVQFISDYAKDQVGDLVDSFLTANGIGTHYVNRYTDGKTALALAFLDDQQNASYTFYKDFPANRLAGEFPEPQEHDIVLFGSFFALTREIRNSLIRFLEKARNANCLILYDPNFRKAHLHELDALRPFLEENFSIANLIKGSDDDFRLIYGVDSVDEAWEALNRKNITIVYTANRNGVYVKSPQGKIHCPVPEINPVSTIGAGDTFSAGIIYSLIKNNLKTDSLPTLPVNAWFDLLKPAIAFASHVCMSMDNYVSYEFVAGYREVLG